MNRTHHTAFLQMILGALGVSGIATGCNEVEIVGRGGGGAGSTSSKSSTSTSSKTSTSSATSNVSAISAVATTGSGMCPQPISSEQIMTPTSGPCSGPYIAQYICFPQTSGVPCDQAYPQQCVLEAYECGFQSVGDKSCGPDQTGNGCCYTVVGDCPIGRPFLVDGAARLAAIASTRAWIDAPEALETASLDARTRDALAAHWSQEALAEHASIASFSRFMLELLGLGAPLELVLRTERALADEIAHARIAFTLASAYRGEPVGPSPLRVDRSLGTVDRRGVAIAVAREGCVAETVSAVLVAAARDAATEPTVRAALAAIADEEAEHVALAWRTLGWILDAAEADERDAMEAELRAVFATAGDHVGLGPSRAHEGDAVAMRAHGWLPIEERRTIAHQVLRAVVAPAASALFDRRSDAAAACQNAPTSTAPGIDALPSV